MIPVDEIPVLAYPGAKGRMGKALVNLMPPEGRCFIDLFAGRGNVFWAAAIRLPGFSHWRINDIQTARFFEAIQAEGNRVYVPQTIPEMRRMYGEFKKDRPNLSTEAILLEPYLSPRGGYGPGGPATKCTLLPESFRRRMKVCHQIMNRLKPRVTAMDWRLLLKEPLGPKDFVYLDPPYYKCKVRGYDAWPLEDYLELVDTLSGLRCKWMLSEYSQPFYTKAFGEPIYTKETRTAVNNSGDHNRTECVWTNYRR